MYTTLLWVISLSLCERASFTYAKQFRFFFTYNTAVQTDLFYLYCCTEPVWLSTHGKKKEKEQKAKQKPNPKQSAKPNPSQNEKKEEWLPRHIPPVQLADSRLTLPWQNLPPLTGAGLSQERVRCWRQSGPQLDHLDHWAHAPSTTTQPQATPIIACKRPCLVSSLSLSLTLPLPTAGTVRGGGGGGGVGVEAKFPLKKSISEDRLC